MKLSTIESKVVGAGVVVASLAVFVMMLVGAGDAFFTFAGHPIPGALELAELLMVLVVFLALPDAEARGKHIVIDIVTSRLPKSFRPRAWGLGRCAVADFLRGDDVAGMAALRGQLGNS